MSKFDRCTCDPFALTEDLNCPIHGNPEANMLMARGLRIAVIQQEYNKGNLTEEEARELLDAPLTPGDNSTYYNDSDQLKVKEA